MAWMQTQAKFRGGSLQFRPQLLALEDRTVLSPTVATAAKVAPSPVTGTTAALSVLGADSGGEANLTYTWAVSTQPAGAAASVNINGTNAAKNATVTFNKAGSYTFAVTIKNALNQTASSQVTCAVNQTLSAIALSPGSATLNLSGTKQFAASGTDQFGAAMTLGTVTWSLAGGSGTVSTAGKYTAPAALTTATVKAASGSVSTTATVSVVNGTPTISKAAYGDSSSTAGKTLGLHALGADDGGAANLKYTWTTIALPAGASSPTFSANGTNAAQNSTATFNRAGSYTFQVSIADAFGAATASAVSITVLPTVTALTLSPAAVVVDAGNSTAIAPLARDQFGQPIASPVLTWRIQGGDGGSVAATGKFTAGTTAGTALVEASSGTVKATASVTINARTLTGASATLAGRVLTVLGAAAGNQTFTFHQSSRNGSDLLWIEGLSILTNGVLLPTVSATAIDSIVVRQLGSNSAVDLSGGKDGTAPVQLPANLTAGGGVARLVGGAGNDTLTGGSGTTTLDGGAGINRLVGGAGNSSFVTRNAADTLVNGAGSNATTSYVYTASATAPFVTFPGVNGNVYIPGGLQVGRKYPVVAFFLGTTNTSMISAAEREKFIIYNSGDYYNNSGLSLTTLATNFFASLNNLRAALPFADASKTVVSGMSGGAKFANFLNIFPDFIVSGVSPGWAYAMLENSDSLTSVMNDNGYTTADLPSAATLAASGNPGRIAALIGVTDTLINGHNPYAEVNADRSLFPPLGFGMYYQEFNGGHSIASASLYDGSMQWLLGDAPLVAVPARATVANRTATLSVLADDAAGAAGLTYTWSAVRKPAGALNPTFSANGTNAARNAVATFARPGEYLLRATCTNPAGMSSISEVWVTIPKLLQLTPRDDRGIAIAPIDATAGNYQLYSPNRPAENSSPVALPPAVKPKTAEPPIAAPEQRTSQAYAPASNQSLLAQLEVALLLDSNAFDWQNAVG